MLMYIKERAVIIVVVIQ